MQATNGRSFDVDSKPWLAAYPDGIPPTVELRFASLVELFDESFRRYADRAAFCNFGTTINYGELDSQSRAFAAYLHSLGLKKGDRVAVMLPNILQYPIAAIGILRAGLTVVNTNPLYTPHELEHQLCDSGASAIVILENCAHVLEKVLARTGVRHVITTQVGDLLSWPRSWLVNAVLKYVRRSVPPFNLPGSVPYSAALARGRNRELRPGSVGSEDIAFLQYTGGTTGTSKGAMLTHGNMVANILQCGAWQRPLLHETDEVVVTALPLYHIFALTVNCLNFIQIGALNLLITDPRDSKGLIGQLKKQRFTVLIGVNTLFNRLLNTEGFSALNFSELKLTLGGGTAVQQSVADQWFKVTGSVLVEGYGLTEASPMVCANPLDIKKAEGYIGMPVPSTECTVRDDEGRVLPFGAVGELWFRGPQIMRGYWNNPAETALTLTPDGWLRTGDVGCMDERGYVKLVDRKKDIIKVSGFSVFPNEIEEVVAAHPEVLEVAAIGHPDAESGEVVKLFVVRKDANLTAEALRQYCRDNMVAYKVPKYIEFRSALPKSPVGKILRRELRNGEAA